MSSRSERGHSLTRRLAVRIFAVALLSWAVVVAVSYQEIRSEVDELYDGELAQLASVMLTLYTAADGQRSKEALPPAVLSSPFDDEHNYERKLVLQIWHRDGRLLLRSPNAPAEPISALPHGFERTEVLGHPVIAYTLAMPGEPYLVRVAQRVNIRSEIASEILEVSRNVVLFSMPLLLLALYLGIRGGLKPLREIEQEISTRSADNLEPVPTRNAPIELHSVIGELNQLLERLRAALENERQLVANATHELRTPLAGIRSNVQVALQASDETVRREALARAEAGVVNATHLAEQLLSQARVDTVDPRLRPLSLAPVVGLVMGDLAAAAKAKMIRLEHRTEGPDALCGNRELIYILLRNLVDNAVRHSPAGGAVTVTTWGEGGVVTIRIEDEGPGIPEREREKVFQRFYRAEGSATPGTGLGLSIVHRVVALHHGRIELAAGADGVGLVVTVELPAADSCPSR